MSIFSALRGDVLGRRTDGIAIEAATRAAPMLEARPGGGIGAATPKVDVQLQDES